MLTADHDFSENDSFGFDILQGEGLFSDDESSNSTRGNILRLFFFCFKNTMLKLTHYLITCL
jgi:hypothetical protein